jgi:hypothetical protein
MDHDFQVDVPRITLYVDGAGPVDTSDPSQVWTTLVDALGDTGATRCRFFLTQACLADVYIKAQRELDHGEFLLSNAGAHEVHLNTEFRDVTVTKTFRLVRIEGDVVWDVDVATVVLGATLRTPGAGANARRPVTAWWTGGDDSTVLL